VICELSRQRHPPQRAIQHLSLRRYQPIRHDTNYPAVSKSLICNFIQDPWSWKNYPKTKTTTAMKAGSVLDCLLTEPNQFKNRYIVSEYDEFRTNASKEWRSEMEASGLVVLKQSELETAQAQLFAIKSKPEAAALLDGAKFQVAFRHATKYPFASKGLIDILVNDGETICDLKTCAPSALESKHSLRRYIFDWMYHVQAGAYCDGYALASGEERTRFKFIFITSAPPFKVAVVELPFSAISLGADVYRNGLKQFAECLETGIYPSIWDGEIELDIPDYAYTENQ
jgi:hypothetical protein